MKKLLSGLFLCFEVYASVEKGSFTEIDVGNAMNRIEVKEGLRAIVGNEQEYKIISDFKSRSIFLIPKVSGAINLSLIKTNGEVLDLKLDAKEIGAQVIKISSDDQYCNIEASQAKQLLECMQQERLLCCQRSCKSKYWITDLIKPKLKAGIKFISGKVYRWKNIVGYHVVIKNLTKKAIDTELNDYSISGKVLLGDMNKTVAANKVSEIFVVLKND